MSEKYLTKENMRLDDVAAFFGTLTPEQAKKSKVVLDYYDHFSAYGKYSVIYPEILPEEKSR